MAKTIIKIGEGIDTKKPYSMDLGTSVAGIKEEHLDMTIRQFVEEIAKSKEIKNGRIEIFGIEFWSESQKEN